MAPADKPMAMRLADYLAGRRIPRSRSSPTTPSYGTDGMSAMRAGVRARQDAGRVTGAVADRSSDVASQVLAARRAGATTLVVWAGASIVAATIQAARCAGWDVPIWAGPTGEDPLVRQQLASHVDWLDGVGFVSFRITARGRAEAVRGATARSTRRSSASDKVGVQQDGKDVVQPPDWSMYPYDTAARSSPPRWRRPARSVRRCCRRSKGNVVITGANGDERGYRRATREGVSPDDMYFALFHGFVFAPVTDDLLSQNLPAVPTQLH